DPRAPPIPITMSFDAAVGRVQQILSMQQDLRAPASLLTGATGANSNLSSPSGGSAATTTGTGASFAAALAGAQDVAGSTSLTGAPVAVQTMLQKAQSLVGRPYV